MSGHHPWREIKHKHHEKDADDKPQLDKPEKNDKPQLDDAEAALAELMEDGDLK